MCRARFLALGPAILILFAEAGPAIEDKAQADPSRSVSLPAPGREPWTPIRFADIEKHTRYERVELDGRSVLRAESRCSASGLALALEDIDLRATPRLAWRWRVERGLDVPNERTREGDDFAARVYVNFPFVPEEASLWERMRRRVVDALYPHPLPGKSLVYVWASREPPGSHWSSPYAEDAWIQVLRSGSEAQGAWREEIVDVVADYRRRFGSEPPAVQSIALMSDSDNVCGHAVAYFTNLRFLVLGVKS